VNLVTGRFNLFDTVLMAPEADADVHSMPLLVAFPTEGMILPVNFPVTAKVLSVVAPVTPSVLESVVAPVTPNVLEECGTSNSKCTRCR
jgi:hypothetical protein